MIDQTTMILFWETIAVSVLGVILHFAYAWSGKNKLVAIFASVNESTWEHIKLALSGLFACTLVDVWFLGSNPNYWAARSLSFLVPMVMIPTVFYTYTTFTKRPILIIDIISFIIATFLSTWLFAAILNMRPVNESGGIISMVTSVIVISMYLLLTWFPIKGNFLFRDPLTGKYGRGSYRSQKKPSPK